MVLPHHQTHHRTLLLKFTDIKSFECPHWKNKHALLFIRFSLINEGGSVDKNVFFYAAVHTLFYNFGINL